MIREVGGTVFITADAFCDRYNFHRIGAQFSYASGDLAEASKHDEDARALRHLVLEMAMLRKIRLTHRPREGDGMEYLATRLAEMPMIHETTPGVPTAPSISTSELAQVSECCDEQT